MKKTSKIRYVILIIAVISGFSCIFTTGVQGKSTELVFEATAEKHYDEIPDWWMEDDVTHLRYYRENSLSGTIDGIEFIGHNEVTVHIIIEATGDFTVHGKHTWYITWYQTCGEVVGTFYGHVNGKGFNPPPIWPWDGYYDGKIRLQGAGDFKGWKLFSILWGISTEIIEFSGTVLIPKYEN